MARIGDRSEMEGFVRSVELGGFSAAARELKLTPSALSKLVSRLESSLGVQLLVRTTRNLRPTVEGEILLARFRTILAAMEDAESELTSSMARPRGKLRMHAGVGFATHQLVPVLPRFVERFPDVQVELMLGDHSIELGREQVDVSVWPGEPADASAIARKLCDFERVLCASPEYLERHGVPRTPNDLTVHNCLRIAGLPSALAAWSFGASSDRRVVDVSGNVSANNAECIRRLALAGLGIARMNEFMVSEDLRNGRLCEIVIDSMRVEPLPLYVQYLPAHHRLPRVGVMVEFLAECFAGAPWRTSKTDNGANQANDTVADGSLDCLL